MFKRFFKNLFNQERYENDTEYMIVLMMTTHMLRKF